MAGHARARTTDILLRIALAQPRRFVQREAGRQVAVERIVRRGLVGGRVRYHAARHELGMHRRRVADEPDAQRAAGGDRLATPGQRLVERARHAIAVARLHAPPDARLVHLDRQAHAAVHRDRERLGAAHAAEPGGDDEAPGERALEVPVGALRERLERALHDALGADVDPRARRHLPEHDEALALQLPELLPRRPPRHEQRVRDQDARRQGVRAEDPHRLAGLDEQRFVRLQAAQALDDAVERFPGARRLAGAAVDDEVVRALGDLGIQVVHQHAQRGLLDPALARAGGPARGAHHAGAGGRERAHALSTSSASRSGARDSTQAARFSHASPNGRSPSGAGTSRRTAP